MPSAKIVVNLAPGFLKKNGSGFDFPIAAGILAATKQIDDNIIKDFMLVGELSLDGSIRLVPGILAYAIAAKKNNINLLSADSSKESINLSGIEQWSITSILDLKEQNLSPIKFHSLDFNENIDIDFKDIAGHEVAKRALQIAACGNHGVLFVGPPGSGKSMLASRMLSILPELTEEEKLETAVIHSIAGENVSSILSGQRPFRSPHHSASLAGLIGGGNPVRPGEVTLSHNGILYLDEIAEFSKHVIQGIRQPLESDQLTIIRADGAVTFPSKFSLIAASNPCPCGYFGDSEHKCTCTPKQISNYQLRLGGPILDRIDMHIDVNRIDPKSVLSSGSGTSSKELKSEVLAGIKFRDIRLANSADKLNNQKGKMESLISECNLNNEDFEYFAELASKNNMSGRGIMRVLSVARTIADLEQKEKVTRLHLCEALTYRLRKYDSSLAF